MSADAYACGRACDRCSFCHLCRQAQQTAKAMLKIEELLIKLDKEGKKPDAVIVYGDTNATPAGALAAVKLEIPVIHIEAAAGGPGSMRYRPCKTCLIWLTANGEGVTCLRLPPFSRSGAESGRDVILVRSSSSLRSVFLPAVPLPHRHLLWLAKQYLSQR